MKNIFILFTMLATTVMFGQDPSEGLLLHYEFNGDAIDSSGNGQDGTTLGATPTANRFGDPNMAMLFDGVNDYIEMPNVAALKPDLPVSFSFWIRYDSEFVSDRDVFNTSFKEDESSGIFFNSTAATGKYSVSFGDGSPTYNPTTRRTYTNTKSIDVDGWHHVVLVVSDATDMKIYVDCNYFNGVYSGSGGDLFYSSTPGNIGRHDRDIGIPANYFKGAIDDFRYYDRELTDADIELLCSSLSVPDVTEAAPDEASILLYPNPVTDYLNLEPKGGIFERLEVYNTMGQRVYSGVFTNLLYVGNFPAGMYVVKSNSDKGTSSVWFVKQ
ncbi:MAG: LamG-like jellyroll fold domain-containing protein [Gilvibacter sp.]